MLSNYGKTSNLFKKKWKLLRQTTEIGPYYSNAYLNSTRLKRVTGKFRELVGVSIPCEYGVESVKYPFKFKKT